MIPHNHDNPTALASTDPARWQDAQTRAWQEEQNPPEAVHRDHAAWRAWWADRQQRLDAAIKTIDPNADESNLKGILGAHGHWQGPVADAVKAFVRQMLVDVEEREREGKAKLEAISQETFNATK
jgi:hypothetical protein